MAVASERLIFPDTLMAAPTNPGPLPSNALFLAGATAVGKSEVALLLAKELGGEILSVDSMQVYRGMDIGTAKPDSRECEQVPHHLIDLIDLEASYDAARFVRDATAVMSDLSRRGVVPIFCGGTGLYFKALLGGLGASPPADPDLRASLEETSLDALLAELQAKDPETWQRIDRSNPRRVIRAVEILRLTGQPVSEQRADWTDGSAGDLVASRFFVLHRAPDDLKARVDARVDRMFDAGLVEETRGLLEHGLRENPVALQAIGYRQVVDCLDGRISLEEARDLVKRRTRQFARRQGTWFRNQQAGTWIEVAPGDDAISVARRILEKIS